MIRVNKLNSKVYQIKVIDTSVRDFHGCVYPVKEGSSYNCYLILDEQITLVDLVDDIYFPQVLNQIKQILGDLKIDNVIVNHVEPDHAGGYELLIKEYPNLKSYTSRAGEKAMQSHFFGNYEYTTVGFGDELKTGEYTLKFFETPLVHWPDNMWTYLEEEHILFSNDAFGQLLVDDVSYDFEVGLDRLLDFSKEYYANIVWPQNTHVGRLFNKFLPLGWEIKIIAPSHGVMLKSHIAEMYRQYQDFVANKTKKKAVIVYETMWGNSQTMGQAIKGHLDFLGYETKMYQLSKTRVSKVLKELVDAELLVIGSGNYNNCVLPPVADFLERLKASRFTDRKSFVFGSYGWMKVPLQNLVERLEDANFKVIGDPLYIQYVPNELEIEDLKAKLSALEL
jgi:flavorubredoxin